MPNKLYRVRIPEWARHLFEGRDRESARFSNPERAEVWVKQIELKIQGARLDKESTKAGIEPKRRSITLDDATTGWLNTLEASGRSPATMKSYREGLSHVLRLAGGTLLEHLDLDAWDEYAKTRRREGASSDALFRERQRIQAAAKWAGARGCQVHPQTDKIPKPDVIPLIERRYDPAAFEAALAKLSRRDRVIAEFLGGTGLRAAEVIAAKVEWINWDQRCVEVPHTQQSRTKGKKPRRLALYPRLERVLKEWIGDRSKGPLFPPERRRSAATRLNPRTIIRRFKAVGLIPDGPYHGIHDIRHHFLSQLARHGADIKTVQEAAGHAPSSLAITARYMHAAPDHLELQRRAMEKASGEPAGTKVGTGEGSSSKGEGGKSGES